MTNEQAIQILKNMISNQRIMTAEMYEAIGMAIEALSAQPERKGEWRHYEGEIECSRCMSRFYDEMMDLCGSDVPAFCPCCGSDNRGEVWWLGKRCENCGDERCKKLGVLPKGYSCALWKDKVKQDG